jgi:hypothetical protein
MLVCIQLLSDNLHVNIHSAKIFLFLFEPDCAKEKNESNFNHNYFKDEMNNRFNQ